MPTPARKADRPRGLVAPGKKPVKIAGIYPNEGVRAEYQRRLERLVDEMNASVTYWLTAAYKANEPATMARDESSANTLNRVMRALARRWNKRFAELSQDLARHFATSVAERTDGALKAALKRGGFTVEFRLSAAANDVLQSTVQQNVSLIKSISSQYLGQVQEMVMRSVAQGRDIGGLTKELQDRYGITRRRAAFIARDQNNRSTADIQRVRQVELGVISKWRHSGAGKHKRPDHVAADGQEYDPAEGCLISGEKIYPGQKPGCRCIGISVIPALQNT